MVGMISTEREMGPPTIHNLEIIGHLEMIGFKKFGI